MAAFLLIENPGVAPPEAFTLLGASTKRAAEETNYKGVRSIGTFGSGAKHALTLLLRHDVNPVVFTSKLKMSFGTKPVRVADDISGRDFEQVTVTYSGTNAEGRSRSGTQELGFVVGFGENDWHDVKLALREYVSNAIDHALKYNEAKGTDKKHPWDGADVRIVGENQVRAKEGFTRVFVPLTSEVESFFNNLGKWFLHFSEPESLNKTLLPRNGRSRNLDDGKTAVVYRRGVRVREYQSEQVASLFDYNLESLRLDESRQVDDYAIVSAAALAVRDAGEEELVRFLTAFRDKEAFWEEQFDANRLYLPYWEPEEQKAARKALWEKALGRVVDPETVIGMGIEEELLARKGHRMLKVSPGFRQLAYKIGLRTVEAALTTDERQKRDILDATPSMVKALDLVWGVLVEVGQTKGKERPPVYGFRQMMEGGSMTHGFYRDGAIYVNVDFAPEGEALSMELLQTVFEEVGHYVTEATDNSRDFQEFFIRLVASLVLGQRELAAA